MQDSYTNEQVERWCRIAEDDGKRWGAMEERRRIIKLLESYYKPEDSKTICTINHEQYLHLIEQIKGEQK